MSRPHSTVLFDVSARGVKRRDLRAFAAQLEERVAGGRAFTCLITSDESLRAWNRQFRKRDYATDVLSFPAGGPAGNPSLGDIAISFERAREQAGERGHGTAEEIRILLLHGVLHLTGLDHERDSGRMARAERRWRKHFGLPRGLIERARP